MTKCKNCGHDIIKRNSTKGGIVGWDWVHKNGGNYCKVLDYSQKYYGGKCMCNNAEPEELKSSLEVKGEGK
jgi:hypothetical protein